MTDKRMPRAHSVVWDFPPVFLLQSQRDWSGIVSSPCLHKAYINLHQLGEHLSKNAFVFCPFSWVYDKLSLITVPTYRKFSEDCNGSKTFAGSEDGFSWLKDNTL